MTRRLPQIMLRDSNSAYRKDGLRTARPLFASAYSVSFFALILVDKIMPEVVEVHRVRSPERVDLKWLLDSASPNSFYFPFSGALHAGELKLCVSKWSGE